MFLQIIILNFISVAYVFFSFPSGTISSLQGEEVSQWAKSLGKDLWTMGESITQYTEIKQKYTFLNAKIQKKNPEELLAEIKLNFSIMIERKISAIKLIQQQAEKFAEQPQVNISKKFKYYSSRFSPLKNEKMDTFRKTIWEKYKDRYKNMTLNNDTHFYNLAVNTNYSSVHVPINVYELDDNVSFAIQWSQSLDDIFKENYKLDPALSWQYFGSTTGIMRHYPAHKWPGNSANSGRDLLLFDCRIRTWFIEAATCTKDVVILIDNSGSMTGIGHHIAVMTASSILDTFSNNDYVNILNYSSVANYTIPCFANMLVQATEENISIFKSAISKLIPDGKTQLDHALQVAFELLASYRVKRNCDGEDSNCNQAIMIITDGVNGNLSDVILKYNYLNNGSNIPVRIFTYAIGKDAANVEEIKWMSCANRGYYTSVVSLEQITASVLKYISVIARPLVLQAEEHPVSWTHAYADLTYDDKNDITINEPYRLLSSVAIPCYDTKVNKMNDTRTAYLLGVVGTDVPIDEFTRLTVPYKIGVNGYAFIVSNNGYVLMHPDLRPMFEGILKENYNSIDLTQVEQHAPDGESFPRVMPESVMKLRQAMVDGANGSMRNIKLSYHYDDMRRVFEGVYDYYYTPIEDTPFTVGIAIPHKYGNYSLEVGDEILRNKHTGENLTSFFTGKWKIHPKWVYCKYHYLEDHEFPTPEKELLHFLAKMYDRNFKWESQYEETRKHLEQEDYYCDMHLVQRLIFDARNTHDTFMEKWVFKPRQKDLFRRYNASLRFVATMSGLTRWNYIFEDEDNYTIAKGKEFGDLHPRAINEKWYKSAVLQHQYDESFVYSVPFDAGQIDDPMVTGSFAIFPSDGGFEAPGSVVGFQFSQRDLQTQFKKVSNKLTNQCSHCSRCNDSLDCYIIDSSGYIIVSENEWDTGRFFGEIEGDIFESMVVEDIYRNVTLYDYQALCKRDTENSSSSSPDLLITPMRNIQTFVNWILTKMLYFILEMSFYKLHETVTYAQDFMQNNTDDIDVGEAEESVQFNNSADNYYACETQLNLFVLRQDIFIEGSFNGEVDYKRNYYVKRIPNSNLIFVAINNTLIEENKRIISTDPVAITLEPEFEYWSINTTLLPCQKLNLNNLSRRRLTGCYNEHPLEHEIIDCGRASLLRENLILVFLTMIFVLRN
nr:voltage-dependent calcium channel subunit alpha-2/delta-3-like [Leptinotarsa decemlineata]